MKRTHTTPYKSRIMHHWAVRRCASDRAFRAEVSLYGSAAINFLYSALRGAAGAYHGSVWFISTAVYYLLLAALRTHIIICRRNGRSERLGYRTVARLLFLLNVPMGGIIILTIKTGYAFHYPGHIIYLTALYTFYSVSMSAVNLVRFRRIGSPLLSAAKVLDLVSAIMSVLCLQTSMITTFSSHSGSFRVIMNTITGTCVYFAVIGIGVFMLLRSRTGKMREDHEQIGKQIL